MFKQFIERQLSFFFGHSESSLKRQIESRLGRPVSLVLTDNSTSMLSARVKDGTLYVRLHRMFLNSDNRVIDEIISFLKNRRGAMPLFRNFIRENREHLREKKPKRVAQKTEGRYHDLKELFDEVNEQYFDCSIDAMITWGSKCSRYAVRKRTLGSYSSGPNIIRINPVLDKRTVPRYFIAFVVYHEMLHAAMGTEKRGGRRIVHSREFKKREKLFRDYEIALRWEKTSLGV